MNSNSSSTRIPIGNRVTIYPRGKKKNYTAEFWFDGQHRRKSLKTQNKKIATDRALKLELQLQEGTYQSVANGVTIEDAIERYLSSLKADNRARKTMVRYRGELETFLEFCHENMVRLLSRITPTLFDSYRSWRSESVKASTQYHESMVCKQLLNWAVSRHLLANNSLANYKLQKPPRRQRIAPNTFELQRIAKAATERDRLLIKMLALTGMRSGELRQLRVQDVDLNGNWLHVVSRDEAPTKTRQSRKIPIHRALKPLLVEQMKGLHDSWLFTAEPSARYPAGDHWINTKKLNDRFVRRLKRLKLPAGLEEDGYTIHSLRHFFETYCVNAGVPQRVVDAWMGHEGDKSMSAVYYHLSDTDSQQFMQKLDNPLNVTDKETKRA